jgi:hypothetical protein
MSRADRPNNPEWKPSLAADFWELRAEWDHFRRIFWRDLLIPVAHLLMQR